jgi:hypothetical protein
MKPVSYSAGGSSRAYGFATKPACAGCQKRLSNYPNNTLNAIMPRRLFTAQRAIERRHSL